MTVVATLPLSESINGRPIIVTASSEPGILIHQAPATELHFLTIYVSSRQPIDYSEALYIRLLKGTPSDGYISDGLYRVIPDQKTQIEPGVLITDSDVHIVIDTTNSPSISPSSIDLRITGQVYVLSN